MTRCLGRFTGAKTHLACRASIVRLASVRARARVCLFILKTSPQARQKQIITHSSTATRVRARAHRKRRQARVHVYQLGHSVLILFSFYFRRANKATAAASAAAATRTRRSDARARREHFALWSLLARLASQRQHCGWRRCESLAYCCTFAVCVQTHRKKQQLQQTCQI